jgi:Flp pilus assembly protein TadG
MRRQHRERGSAAAETALVMAVTLMLVLGIIVFSLLIFDYHTVASMARQGARWAMVRGAACPQSGEVGEASCPATKAEIQSYVQGLALANMTPSDVSVTPIVWSAEPGCSGYASNNGPGCQVAITVSYPFTLSLPLVPMPKAGITLSSTSTMIISQ